MKKTISVMGLFLLIILMNSNTVQAIENTQQQPQTSTTKYIGTMAIKF